MEEFELKTLVEELKKDKTKFVWKPEELESFLISKGFEPNKKNLLKLTGFLSEDYIFRWLEFIGAKLPDIASIDNEFVLLLAKIVKKVRGDMAQGPIIRSLINIGFSNPDLGLALFDKMVTSGDNNLISYAGLVLGGAGKKEFEKALRKIEQESKSSSPDIRVTSIKALRVIFEETKVSPPQKIFEILESAADPKEDSMTRSEAANAYIDFCGLNPEICVKQLFYLAKQGDSNVRFTIAQRLLSVDLGDRQYEIEILTECSRDDSLDTLSRVALALSVKGKDFPEESLEIIRNWIERRKYFEIREIGYCLEEIGKGNLSKCIEVVASWVDRKEPIFSFYVPEVLSQISVSNYQLLFGYLRKWSSEKERTFKKIIIRTISDVILGMHRKPSDEIISGGFSLLKEFAQNDELQDSIRAVLVEIFGRRPYFTEAERLISLVEDWTNDEDWKVRKAVIVALRILAENKVDSKETLKIQINKETGETKIIGRRVEKIELPEGVKSYALLQKLAIDRNNGVSQEAKDALVKVDKLTQEKEDKIGTRESRLRN